MKEVHLLYEHIAGFLSQAPVIACFGMKLVPCSLTYEILETMFEGVIIADDTFRPHDFFSPRLLSCDDHRNCAVMVLGGLYLQE